MSCSGDDHLRICVFDLKQRTILSFKSFWIRNIVAYLNINSLTFFWIDKTNFFLIELSNIYIITSSHQFDADHIFIETAIIYVSVSQYRVTDAAVTQIVFFCA